MAKVQEILYSSILEWVEILRSLKMEMKVIRTPRPLTSHQLLV